MPPKTTSVNGSAKATATKTAATAATKKSAPVTASSKTSAASDSDSSLKEVAPESTEAGLKRASITTDGHDSAEGETSDDDSGIWHRRAVRRVSTRRGSTFKKENDVFLHILELLEENDEFNSSGLDDLDSEAGDSEVSIGSSEESDDEDMQWDDSMKLTAAELDHTIYGLRHQQLPKLDVSRRLVHNIIRHYQTQHNLVHIRAPEKGSRLIIVGDLHGHFADLMHILDDHGEPDVGPHGVRYLFNGDFVDRGAWGPEVLLLLYAMKLKCPDGVFLNRGNHEDRQQNLMPDNGFVHSHCTRAFGAEASRMYNLIRKSFLQLPLCSVVGKEVFVVHGGLPVDTSVTIEDINAINRRVNVPIKSTCLLGYPKNQAVAAKRDLETEDGEKIFQGAKGRIVERVGKSQRAIVRFTQGGMQDEVEVTIQGAPELEDDVEILYSCEEERHKSRQQRIFVAMLWSDPVMDKNQKGPSKRGAGAFFDAKVTLDFLKVNKLKCLLRSHEKRDTGFSEEHKSSKGQLMAATVFSASNYPRGAGEPFKGNRAAVVQLEHAEGTSLVKSINPVEWREPYEDELSFQHLGTMSEEMRAKFQAAKDVDTKIGPRARTLAKLRELTYCARPKLLEFWQRVDPEGTGFVDMDDWARAMRSCVIKDDDFPWEWLRPYMLRLDEKSDRFNYAGVLSQYGNSLSRKLAKRWHGGSILSIVPGVQSKEDAEAAWDKVDRNGDGKLSYSELRPILRNACHGIDKTSDEDHLYSLLTAMDKDATGFVDREEFVSSVVGCLTGESLFEEALRDDSVGRFEKSRRQLAISNEMSKWSEEDIAQCWASTQGVIRALSTTTGCASAVFAVLDTDSDGIIDRKEFQDGLKQLLKGSHLLKNLERWEPLLWRLVDEDNSGYVSPEELNLAFSVRETLSI